MNQAVLRPYFYTGTADMLADVPGLGVTRALAEPMHGLAKRVASDAGLLRSLEADAEDALDPAELSLFLSGLAERLETLSPQTIPSWIRVAQDTRDWISFPRLPLVAGRLTTALCEELPPHQATLAHGYLSDVLRALDVFSQRFTLSQNASQLSDELVQCFLESGFEDYDANVSAAELGQRTSQVISEWAQCSTDMGIVVDLEFMRLFVDRVLVSTHLDENAWVALALSLDAALAARSHGRPDHILRSAIDALLGMRTMLRFFRDVAEDALLYIPTDAQPWGDLCVALMISACDSSGESARRFAESLNLRKLATCFGARGLELQRAVRHGANSLRRKWESNYVDRYTDAADQLLAWAGFDAASTGPAAVLASHISVAGRDMSERRVIARCVLSRVPPEMRPGIVQACAELDPATRLSADGSDACVEQVLMMLAAPTETVARAAGTDSLAARLCSRADLLMSGSGAAVAAADVALQLSILSAVSADALLVQLKQDVASLVEQQASSSSRLLADALMSLRASHALRSASPTLLDGLSDDLAGRGLMQAPATFYAVRVLQHLERVLGAGTENPGDALLRTVIDLKRAHPSLRASEQRLVHEVLAARINASLGEELSVCAASLLAYTANKATGIDLRRTRDWDMASNFLILNEYGPLWASVFSRRRQPIPHHERLVTLVDQPVSETLSESVSECWRAYATAWSRLGDPLAAWSPALQSLKLELNGERAKLVRRDWLVAQARIIDELDPSEAAFFSLLLAHGLDRFNHAAQAEQILEWSAHSLEPCLSAIGQGELEPLILRVLRLEADERKSVRGGLAGLNVMRFLLERAVPESGIDAAGWKLVWESLHDALHAHFPDASDRLLCARQLGLYAQICRGADDLRPALPTLLTGAEPIYADDPSEESHWRALVSGVLACALLRDLEPAMVEELALSSVVLDQHAVLTWAQRNEALQRVFDDNLPPDLATAARQTLAELGTSVSRAVALSGSDSCSGLDCALALRSLLPSAAQCWRLDRLVRNRLEGLTSPMPGDLTVGPATGWSLVEGLVLRRAANTLMEVREFTQALVEDELKPLTGGLPIICARSAFLRDGLPTPALSTNVASLLAQHWSTVSVDELCEHVAGLRDRLLEEFGRESAIFERYSEYSHQAITWSLALSSSSQDVRVLVPGWMSLSQNGHDGGNENVASNVAAA